jgi:hypothetical protein
MPALKGFLGNENVIALGVAEANASHNSGLEMIVTFIGRIVDGLSSKK